MIFTFVFTHFLKDSSKESLRFSHQAEIIGPTLMKKRFMPSEIRNHYLAKENL